MDNCEPAIGAPGDAPSWEGGLRAPVRAVAEAVLRMGVEEGLLDPAVLDVALVDACVTQFLAGHPAKVRS